MQAHLGPRQEKKNVCLPLLLRKMTPRGHKSCYGLFRSVDCSKIPDNTHTQNATFSAPGSSNSPETLHRMFGPGRAIDRTWSNQSGRIACNCGKRRDRSEKKMPPENAVRHAFCFQIQPFSPGISWPLRRGKPILGGLTTKLGGWETYCGIYKHAQTASWRKRRLLYSY